MSAAQRQHSLGPIVQRDQQRKHRSSQTFVRRLEQWRGSDPKETSRRDHPAGKSRPPIAGSVHSQSSWHAPDSKFHRLRPPASLTTENNKARDRAARNHRSHTPDSAHWRESRTKSTRTISRQRKHLLSVFRTCRQQPLVSPLSWNGAAPGLFPLGWPPQPLRSSRSCHKEFLCDVPYRLWNSYPLAASLTSIST